MITGRRAYREDRLYPSKLERVEMQIDAAVAAEREACAKIADSVGEAAFIAVEKSNDDSDRGRTDAAIEIAAEIRARAAEGKEGA